MIRNIIFDMGHVLLSFRPLDACRALLTDENDAQALCEAFFGQPLWTEIDLGIVDGDTFTDAVKLLLDKRLHPAVDALYQSVPQSILPPVEGMAALTDKLLQDGYRVYLLSNAGLFMSRGRNCIPHIQRFHGVIFSGDEGIIKPDPRLFRLLMTRYSLQPEECFFIDDNDFNIRAAASLGWQTYRFDGDVAALQTALNAL